MYSRDGEDAPVRSNLPARARQGSALVGGRRPRVCVRFESTLGKLSIENLVQGLDEYRDRPALIQHNGIMQGGGRSSQ